MKKESVTITIKDTKSKGLVLKGFYIDTHDHLPSKKGKKKSGGKNERSK